MNKLDVEIADGAGFVEGAETVGNDGGTTGIECNIGLTGAAIGCCDGG